MQSAERAEKCQGPIGFSFVRRLNCTLDGLCYNARHSRTRELRMRHKGFVCFGIAVGALLALVLVVTACGPETPTSQPSAVPTNTQVAAAATATPTVVVDPSATVTPDGLQYVEIVKGSGPAPKTGEVVTVNYTASLQDGTEFDNSYKSGEPLRFAVGKDLIITGLDEGIAMMNVGGKAKLIVPPALAFGDQGAGGVVPASATLVFVVELVSVEPGSPESPQKVAEADFQTTADGLKYHDFKVGDGPAVQAGQVVTVTYTGWLTDGTKFDSSIDRGAPFSFTLGQNQVIPGWDEGVGSMKVGGQRQLVIPASLGYGAGGAGDLIPPNATLIFEIELLAAK